MNLYGPHSNFIPQSPLSYSTSYSPISPLKENQVKLAADAVAIDPGKVSIGGVGPTNKSILKNPTTLFFKEQQKKLMKNGENLVEPTKKTTENPTVLRKETPKTVAFGLTTRLEDTVLAGKHAASSTTNRLSKTAIFSHEAQSLHKIILAQQTEINELREKINELSVSDARHRENECEQKCTINEFSARLALVEQTLASITKGTKCHEENKENDKINANKYSEYENLMGDATEAECTAKEGRVKTSVGKRMVLRQRQLNNEGKDRKDFICSHKRNVPMPPIVEETSFLHRKEILQRLDCQMRKNPNFEDRIKSMLRVWTDDVSLPTIGTSVLEHPREENEGGASMVVRVTTQHQEVFYSSSSPGRNKKQHPIPRRQRTANQQPIVTELSDDSSAEEQRETVPNVRRSDHCTDDAEFFRNENEHLDDDFEDWPKRNETFNQNQFRRRKREATSAIRNKYK